MDIATVIGLVASVGLIVWAMDNAAGINAFIDVTSIAIVLGGSVLVLLMRSRLGDFIAMWSKVIMKTIFVGVDKPADLGRHRASHGHDRHASWAGGHAAKHERPQGHWPCYGHRLADHPIWCVLR